MKHFRWLDAQEAAHQLTDGDRRTLLLLARLPLVWAEAMARLSGLRNSDSIYRSLDRLHRRGLVATIHPSFRLGRSPRLCYLTDLGLVTIALDQGIDPWHLARRNRLGRADLLAALPGLPHLVASYELLAALVSSRPGQPNLLAWERPWRRRYQRPTAKAPTTIRLPGYAALSWDGKVAAFLLVPDLATFPLRAYRRTLDQLLVFRGTYGHRFPMLVVATSDGRRAEAWQRLLDEVSRVRREAPFAARIVTWNALQSGLEGLTSLSHGQAMSMSELVQRVRLRPLRPRQPNRPIPQAVGDLRAVPTYDRPSMRRLGPLTLRLSMTDRALLDLVGRHPFLTLDQLATVLGWTNAWTLRQRNRLIARGLMRLVDENEASEDVAALRLVELTVKGLTLVAAQRGLSLGAAVRHNGLAGGGTQQPVGPRHNLVANLDHTLGANAVFVSLFGAARKLAEMGSDDEVVEWRNAAACSRWHVRPDGYGIYRHREQLYGFFLEYDRGTMNGRDYREKFAAYYEYWASRRFEWDYDGFPTILVVTSGPGTEERIVKALRAVGVGWQQSLPVLLTTTERIAAELDGLLGPIWREPSTKTRRSWLHNFARLGQLAGPEVAICRASFIQ